MVMILLIAGSAPVFSAQDIPEITADGLQLVGSNPQSLVYLLPGLEPAAYRGIYLDETSVNFTKHWRRQADQSNGSSVPADVIAETRGYLQSAFEQAFALSLQNNGYPLVESMDEGVLLVRPVIANLDIRQLEQTATGNVYALTEDGSELTLFLELHDALTGARVGVVVDRKAGRKTGYFLWKNRLSNRAAAGRILQAWAESLGNGLNQAGFKHSTID